MSKVLRRLLFSFILLWVPLFAIANSSYYPNIKNHGQYKKLSDLSANNLRQLYGHVPRGVDSSHAVAPLAIERVLDLSIVLPLRDKEGLDKLLTEIALGNEQFLSQKEFVDKFAPTIEHVEKVKEYFVSQGFSIKSVEPNNLIIKTSAQIQDINKTFNTEIYEFIGHDGKKFFAPLYELQIDKSIDILGVQGLENKIQARSHARKLATLGPKTNLANAGGYNPSQIRSAYNLTSSLSGSGQTLALFELDGFTMSDITAYKQAFNLPNTPIQTILIDGFNGLPGSGAGEVTLDIELMLALAPGVSKILVYEGPNSGQGVVDTYNRIATDNLAKSVSTSWGLSETDSTGALMAAENQIFTQMAAQGQAIFAAAGDNGAYDNGSTLSVDDPASQPMVVGVGGTSLYVNVNGSYNSETTWAGGGGGISSVWSIPSWQAPVISSPSNGSHTMRNVPDVALDSDPNTGYLIYFNNGWYIFGGTSCAAPLWAAFWSLVNQGRANAGQASLGFPNPVLYQLNQTSAYASGFHDIKDLSTNGYYPAVNGYDLATGWGTFIADALITNLGAGNNPPPPPVCTRANPSLSISPTSKQGVAGTALSYTLSLTNKDSAACSSATFNLTATTPAGFSSAFSQSSLNIAPGQSATSSIKVTSASSAKVGNYKFSVQAKNSAQPTYISSVSATYSVAKNAKSTLKLSLSPSNATFYHGSKIPGLFSIHLQSGSESLANIPLEIEVKGPRSFSKSQRTASTGYSYFPLFLNNRLPIGQYNLNVSAEYQGDSISSDLDFQIY